MTKKRKNKNKIWYWCGGVILLAAIVVIIIVMSGRFNDRGDIETDEPETVATTQEETKEEVEDDKKEENEEVKNEVTKEEVVQYDGDDPNENGKLSGVITYAGVVDTKLMIRVNIDQYLEDGTCSLVMKRDGKVIYSDTAGISGGAMTSSCEGFDVLVSEFAAGMVDIEIRLNANDKTGIIEGKVEI